MSHSSFRRIGEDRKRDDVTLLVEGEQRLTLLLAISSAERSQPQVS